MQEHIQIAIRDRRGRTSRSESTGNRRWLAAASDEANSIRLIFRSNPASCTIDWITSAICALSEVFGTFMVTVIGVGTPDCFTSAMALARSRGGASNPGT